MSSLEMLVIALFVWTFVSVAMAYLIGRAIRGSRAPGAVAGRSVDGRAFIDAAITRGAAAVIAEAQGRPDAEPTVPTLWIEGLRARLGELAARSVAGG